MEYTEEVIKEAHDVYLKHYRISGDERDSYEHAIQDRQSVLDDNKSVFELLKTHDMIRAMLPVGDRIQSLTQQIDYLKSKL